MEAARNLLASSPSCPPRTHHRNCASSASPVPAVTSVPTASPNRNLPTSILLQEQCDEYKPLVLAFKEDKASKVKSDKSCMLNGTSGKVKDSVYFEQLDQYFERQLLDGPVLKTKWSTSQTHKNPSLSSTMQSATVNTKKLMDVELSSAIAHAKKALEASKRATRLDKDLKIFQDSLNHRSLTKLPLEEVITVRSTRLQERRSKKRWVLKLKSVIMKNRSKMAEANRRYRMIMKEEFDPDCYLSYFFATHKAKRLTAEKEVELITQAQVLKKLEKVKSKLKSHLGREPTMFEWAEGVGISYRALQTHIYYSMRSYERLLYANKYLVLHVAKKYINSGVSLHYLFQVGCGGLMKSIDRFKCEYKWRFSTYAYYWIRHEIQKGMYESCTFEPLSRRTHLLLYRIGRAKRLLALDGNHNPTAEELAECVGIKVAKVEWLLLHSGDPISLEETVEKNAYIRIKDDFVDPTTEPEIETRANQHLIEQVNAALETLPPRDSLILRLRYGIGDGIPRSLANIGERLGITRERVRQLEKKAKERIRKCLDSQEMN
uniref:Sigma factor n=1 Tax=Pelargonium exstipulatum TaxID=59873 RepID=A0A0G2STR9_9ROSI|nr:sigma factor [Pelargonium exstipulatum]